MDNEIIKNYLQSVKEICPTLTSEELSYYADKLTITELKNKDFYIKEGDIQPCMGYIFQGILRVFYTNEKDDAVSLDFLQEKEIASHCSAFTRKIPSRFNYQSVEDSIIINIPYEHFWDTCQKYPAFNHYFRINLERNLDNLLYRTESFLLDNAETRYRNFIKEKPDVFKRISVSMLCSYLGVSRQALTLIRNKTAKNGIAKKSIDRDHKQSYIYS